MVEGTSPAPRAVEDGRQIPAEFGHGAVYIAALRRAALVLQTN